jgi:hypothetical protein
VKARVCPWKPFELGSYEPKKSFYVLKRRFIPYDPCQMQVNLSKRAFGNYAARPYPFGALSPCPGHGGAEWHLTKPEQLAIDLRNRRTSTNIEVPGYDGEAKTGIVWEQR